MEWQQKGLSDMCNSENTRIFYSVTSTFQQNHFSTSESNVISFFFFPPFAVMRWKKTTGKQKPSRFLKRKKCFPGNRILCSFSACVLFYSEKAWNQHGSLITTMQSTPVRVWRWSHELPSHVLVIRSLLVCGARHIRDHMLLAFLVPASLPGQTSYERFLRKFDVW